MARELLSTRTYDRYDHPNYPFDASSPCTSLHLTATVSAPPPPAPTRPTPDERCMRVRIIVLHSFMVLTPTSDGRALRVPDSNDPQGRVVYDFSLPCHNPRPHEYEAFVSTMLPLLNTSSNARHQLMAQMPTFLADAEAEAWRRGFSVLEINAHIVETVDVNRTYVFDYSVDQLVDAATGAGAMEVVKGQAGKVCSVCLDEFMEGMDVSKLKLCSHVFHTRCIGGWLQQSLRNGRLGFRCPIWRSNVIG